MRAERFLDAVARELSSLSSTERDAVLLELRSHLIDQAASGEAALDAALRALGRPADLAAEFDTRHGAALAPVPRAFAVPWRPMRLREVLLEVRATYLASRDGLMMVGLVMAAAIAASSFLWWTQARHGSLDVQVAAAVAAGMAATILAYCAGYRVALTDDRHPWRLTRSTFRFVAAMIAADWIKGGMTMATVFGVRSFMLAAGASPAIVAICTGILAMTVSGLLFCVELRFQPWLVAQAIGRYDVTFGASWRGTSGRVLNILRGWIVIAPLYVLIAGFQLLVPQVVPIGILTLALAGAAGVVSMIGGLASLLLNATIYRWAVEEPIPSAKPFATEPPDASTFEEARARLAMLLASRPTGQNL